MQTKQVLQSRTMQGSVITIASAVVILAKWLGFHLPLEEVVTVLVALGIIAGSVITMYGRWRIGDLHLFTKPESGE